MRRSSVAAFGQPGGRSSRAARPALPSSPEQQRLVPLLGDVTRGPASVAREACPRPDAGAVLRPGPSNPGGSFTRRAKAALPARRQFCGTPGGVTFGAVAARRNTRVAALRAGRAAAEARGAAPATQRQQAPGRRRKRKHAFHPGRTPAPRHDPAACFSQEQTKEASAARHRRSITAPRSGQEESFGRGSSSRAFSRKKTCSYFSIRTVTTKTFLPYFDR